MSATGSSLLVMSIRERGESDASKNHFPLSQDLLMGRRVEVGEGLFLFIYQYKLSFTSIGFGYQSILYLVREKSLPINTAVVMLFFLSIDNS